MEIYDFYKMCENWSVQQPYDTPDDKIQGRANLDNLKLSVQDKDIKWFNFRPLVNEESQKVNVQYNPMHPSLYSGLQASKESELVTEVKLTKGVVRGINKPVRLPVTDETSDLKKIVGSYVKIDPGTTESRSSNKMTVTLGSSHQTNVNQPTQARVSTKQTAYAVDFIAIVSCRGYVTFSQDSTDEQAFAQIIVDLLENRSISGLTVNRRGGNPDSVSWEMAGRCVFRGEFEQAIDWQY